MQTLNSSSSVCSTCLIFSNIDILICVWKQGLPRVKIQSIKWVKLKMRKRIKFWKIMELKMKNHGVSLLFALIRTPCPWFRNLWCPHQTRRVSVCGFIFFRWRKTFIAYFRFNVTASKLFFLFKIEGIFKVIFPVRQEFFNAVIISHGLFSSHVVFHFVKCLCLMVYYLQWFQQSKSDLVSRQNNRYASYCMKDTIWYI